MKKVLLAALWLAGLLAATGGYAAEIGPAEYQYQAAFTLDGPLTSRLGWGLTQTAYLDDNYKMYAYAPQASLTWLTTQRMSWAVGYRPLRVEQEGATYIRQRALVTGNFGLPYHDWRLGYRLRWQGDWRDPEEGGQRYRSYLRNRLQARYAGFGDLVPYGSVEIVHRLDQGRSTSGVDRTGYRLGSELAMGDHQGLDLWGRVTEYTNDNPDVYTFGVEYAYSFR